LEGFLSSLNDYLSQYNQNYDQILCGDINIDILLNNIETVDYLNILYINNCYSACNKPTRISSHSNTCIDHLFVKNINIKEVSAYILRSSITDHFSLILNINTDDLNIQKTRANNNFNCEFKKIDFNHLNMLIRTEDWNTLLDCKNVNTSVENFNNKINDLILASTNYHSHIKRNNNNNKCKLKPWISLGLIKSIRVREKMYNKMRRQPFNAYFKRSYIIYRNILNNLIKIAKNTYYKTQIELSGNNTKKVWDLIKIASNTKINKQTIINEIKDESGKIIHNSKEVANIFNSFFFNVGSNIASNISANGFIYKQFEELNYNCHIEKSIFLSPIDPMDITSLIMKCKDYSSYYEGLLSNTIIKKTSTNLSLPLSIIFNKCFSTGQFPSNFKKSVVIPLYKNEDILSCNNYRPITLTLTIAKFLKKAVWLKTRLVNFLNEHKFFNENQFGFRNNLSTNDALYCATKFIYDNLDLKKHVVGIFLDFKKAFDSVDHKL